MSGARRHNQLEMQGKKKSNCTGYGAFKKHSGIPDNLLKETQQVNSYNFNGKPVFW